MPARPFLLPDPVVHRLQCLREADRRGHGQQETQCARLGPDLLRGRCQDGADRRRPRAGDADHDLPPDGQPLADAAREERAHHDQHRHQREQDLRGEDHGAVDGLHPAQLVDRPAGTGEVVEQGVDPPRAGVVRRPRRLHGPAGACCALPWRAPPSAASNVSSSNQDTARRASSATEEVAARPHGRARGRGGPRSTASGGLTLVG